MLDELKLLNLSTFGFECTFKIISLCSYSESPFCDSFAAHFSCRSLTQLFFPHRLPGRLSVCLATFVVVAWLTVVVGLK